MASNRSKVGTSTESLMNSTPFVGGLNTELSGIIDSTEFTKDELNMMIRPDGTRSRRPGVDYEEAYRYGEQASANIDDPLWVFEAFEWYDVAGPDEAVGYGGQPYIVVQNGYTLQFFLNKGQPFSGNEAEFSLDLRDYKLADKTNEDVAHSRCRFASAYGSLFICSEAIQPVQLRSAQNQEQLVAIPTSTSASTRVSTTVHNAHSSRLRGDYGGNYPGFWIEFWLNNVRIKAVSSQEWYGSLGLSDTQGPWFWCSTQIAQMWNSIPSSTRFGITATPKYADGEPRRLGIYNNTTGVYNGTMYDHAGPEDWVKFVAPAESLFSYRGFTIELKCYAWGKKLGSYAWSNKGTFCGGTAYQNMTGYSLTIRDTSVGAKDYLAIETSPTKVTYAHLYNLYNQGWTNDLLAKYYKKLSCFPANNLAQQYLKDSKTTEFKPEALINTTFGNTPAARGHEILNYFNQQRRTSSNVVAGMYALVQDINNLGVSVTIHTIRELLSSQTDYAGAYDADKETQFATEQIPDYKTTNQYVTDIVHYAGRLFYLVGDTLLYSQMISEDTTKAGYCYTDADPTSEEISDVVETDGGLISLPDLGEGVKLAQVGQWLLIFGTRSNCAISGTANNIFTATAYSLGALNAVPSQAPQSFVNTEFGLLYWGTTGINFIAPTGEGLQVQDVSTPKILTWYGKLTNTQHKYCKGVYSSAKKKIYWFYPSDDNRPCRLDMCLVYDLQRNSFAPQSVVSKEWDEDSQTFMDLPVPQIVSGLLLKTPFKSVKEYPICTIPTESDSSSYEITVEAHENVRVEKTPEVFFTKSTTIFRDDLTNVPSEYLANSRSSGSIYRCDLSQFASMPNETEKVLVKYYGAQSAYGCGPLYYTMNLSRNASGEFYLYVYDVYTSTPGTSTGPYSTSDIIWFINWIDNHGLDFRYFGFASEAEMGGSGYTAQTVPASLLSISKTRGLSGMSMTNSEIICQFDVSLIGDITTGFSKAVIQNSSSSNSFVAFYGSLPQGDIENFYISSVSSEVYADIGNGVLEEVGSVYRSVNTDYDIIVDNRAGDSMFAVYMDTDNTLLYIDWFIYNNPILPSKLPVYTKAGSIAADNPYVLHGFCTRPPTDNDLEYQRLSDSSVLTATSNGNSHWNPVTYKVVQKGVGVASVQDIILKDINVEVSADDPIDSEEFTYESSILVCLDTNNSKVTFGDFRNNLLLDWTAGDWQGPGYVFDSYLVSHPMNASSYSQLSGSRRSDIVHTKNMPYMISYFRRTETGSLTNGDYVYPSKCQGSILWDWRTSGRAGKWSSPTDLYRPHKDTIFDNGFIVNKTNIRGLGRAYQVKLESVDADQFILEGLVFDLKNDGRI